MAGLVLLSQLINTVIFRRLSQSPPFVGHRSWAISLLALAGVLLAVSPTIKSSPVAGAEGDAFYINRSLGRGINLAAALEAPREGEWGVTLQPGYFQAIKDAGFQSVRIPIRWSAHAAAEAPFEINAGFLRRVDWAVEQALSRDLVAVINVHHFVEMSKEPAKNLPRLVGIWKQIAQHYRNRPDRLVFELLNEPEGQLTDQRWQEMIPELLSAVRTSNPQRAVIIGPGYWNSLDHLVNLFLPEEDRRLIVTFHYYQPFQFTHQGASWVKNSDKWKGTTWKGSAQEREALRKDFQKAATWANERRRPLYLGEFGAHQEADMESRILWTRAVTREAEQQGFSWSYFDFGSPAFGAYDVAQRKWRQPLLDALLNKN